jgi:RNA polymerase sigma-32 factor
LTREEEQIVAEEYLQTKSRASAYKLVSSNLWLVVKLAREYERIARNALDLIQEGNIGLMEAVRNFDPHRGVRFPSYAVWWIRAYMIRFIIANWRLVKIGTTQAQRKLFFNLKKESERLERQGIYPSPKLLAEKLNVREGDVVEMAQRLSAPDMSMDAPLQDDNDGSLLSIIPSGEDNAEDVLARKQLHKLLFDTVHEFESLLTEKERVIFQGRVLDEDKSTLQEISDKLSISKERVRQIENKLKDRLRVLLSERMGTELDGVIESDDGGSDE